MTVMIKGYTSLIGKPDTILRLMLDAGVIDQAADGEEQAERLLRELENRGIVRIRE